LDTEASTRGDKGRDLSGCIYKPRHTIKIASKPPEARGKAWAFFLTALRRSQPYQYLDLEFLASRTVRT